MQNTHITQLSSAPAWRAEATKIVEQLMTQCDSEHYDLLLELRGLLNKGRDWNTFISVFLMARHRMEAKHYLLFYRLRRLVVASLKLEVKTGRPLPGGIFRLEALLLPNPRDLKDLSSQLSREMFEHHLDLDHFDLGLQISENASS
ncbi:MAG: hypothetical protein ACFCU3_00205 [Verrucomicrobiales bacterium]